MSEQGSLATVRVPLHDGLELRLEIEPREIRLTLVDLKPRMVRFPHWPAPARTIPCHRASLVLWRAPDTRAPRAPRVLLTEYPT